MSTVFDYGMPFPERINEIMCPYCGLEITELCDYTDESGRIECKCGKIFSYSGIVTVEYSRHKKTRRKGE